MRLRSCWPPAGSESVTSAPEPMKHTQSGTKRAAIEELSARRAAGEEVILCRRSRVRKVTGFRSIRSNHYFVTTTKP